MMDKYELIKQDASSRIISKKEITKDNLMAIYNIDQVKILMRGGELSIDDETYVRLVLLENKSNNTTEILNQRQSQYGDYSDVALITQTIVDSLQKGASYSKLNDVQKTSLFMIANKMARAVNGDVKYKDNYEDICGYSQLVLDELNKK